MSTQSTRPLTLALVSVSALLAVPEATYAYLDPASGSMILQAVIGGVAAAAIAFKYYWRRVASFFGIGREDADDAE